MKAISKPKSRNRWLKKQANHMLSLCGIEDNDVIIALFKAIAKKKGLFIAERSNLSLSTAQSVALRDHVKSSNNDLLRIKQCIECFAPDLKGILLQPNILKYISNMEKQELCHRMWLKFAVQQQRRVTRRVRVPFISALGQLNY